MRRKLAVAAVGASTLSLTTIPAHSATPYDDNSCIGVGGTGSVTRFRLSGAWSTWPGGTEARDFTRQALTSMESERATSGVKLVDWEETLGTDQDITISIANFPPGVAGSSSCQAGTITMDSDFIRDATAGDIRNGVRHEALHMFGAHNTGEMDSRDGFISTLKTCKSGYNLENVLTQDDAISLQYVSDTGYKNFGADPGFESSTHFYGLSGSPTATVLSGGGASGSYKLRYKSTASGQSVYSTTRAMLGDTAGYYAFASGRARGLSGIEAGTFYMQLWSRWIQYPDNDPEHDCSDQYVRPNIWDPNGTPTTYGAMTKRQEGDPVPLSTVTWSSSLSGSPWNPTPATEDAQDLQWRAVASAYDSSGARMAVDLDNLTVESS